MTHENDGMRYPSIDKLVTKTKSKYRLVVGVAKRARQIIDGDEPLVYAAVDKPLSIAVEELNKGEIQILSEDEEE